MLRLPGPLLGAIGGDFLFVAIRCGDAGLEDRLVLHGLEGRIGSAFDRTQKLLLVPGAEGHRDTGCAGSSGPSDAMHVGLGIDRHVVVDHVGDVVHVDAAGGDVGRDQNRDSAVAEGFHRLGAHVLRLVAVNRIGIDRCLPENAGQTIRTVLGLREDQGTSDVLTAEETSKHLLLLRSIHLVEMLSDRLDCRRLGIGLDAHRVEEDGIREGPDLLRHRRGEEKGLMLVGKHLDHLADVVDETHVEHSVGLVQNDGLDHRQIDVPLIDEVQKTTGRRDQDVHARTERLDLVVLTDAAIDGRMLQGELASVGREAVEDLHRQLTGRAEHDRTRQTALCALAGRLGLSHFGTGQTMEDGQCEGAGLARAGLGTTEDITTFEGRRNRLCLNRSRFGVAL